MTALNQDRINVAADTFREAAMNLMLRPFAQKACAVVCAFLCVFLVVAVAGCGDSGYEKKGGQWHYNGHAITTERGSTFKPLTGPFASDASIGYYRGAPIAGSHGPTFKPVDDQYAVDQSRAYFCDTYRKGQEYYAYKHNRIVVLEAVALDSFRSLKRGYARDAKRLYYEGAHVAVNDLETFEVLGRRQLSTRSHLGLLPAAPHSRQRWQHVCRAEVAAIRGTRRAFIFRSYRSVEATLREQDDTYCRRIAGFICRQGRRLRRGCRARVPQRHRAHQGCRQLRDAPLALREDRQRGLLRRQAHRRRRCQNVRSAREPGWRCGCVTTRAAVTETASRWPARLRLQEAPNDRRLQRAA